ncbi:MAG: sortase domain-containing protein, partial [Thermomicrobiales bacterium]
MKRLRYILFPVLVSLAVLSVLTAGASAYTGTGLPSWGTKAENNLKSGPLGLTGQGSKGQVPIAISIPDANVDAEVEKNKIVDGQMLNPSGPWVVSWYQETARAGDNVDYRNIVMSGHVDYWGVGPSVFQSVGSLSQGAQINVTGENGDVFTYAVTKVDLVPAQPTAEQLNQIVGRSKTPVLTIITCGGDFDQAKGEYLSRTIVRANLVDTKVGAAQSGTAAAASDNAGVTTLKSGDQAVTKDDSVNVRSQPSTSGNVILALNKGQTVMI